MPEDLIEFQREDELNELKSAHRRALRALAKKDQQTEELVEAVYRAAKDAAVNDRVVAALADTSKAMQVLKDTADSGGQHGPKRIF